jgi:hypothetical protein
VRSAISTNYSGIKHPNKLVLTFSSIASTREQDEAAMATSITTTTATHTSSDAHSDDSNHNPLLLFGTLNQEIADVMYQSIQEQLMKSLQALPMLQDDHDDDGTLSTTRMGLLYKYLLKHYITAVDLIELYNTRNTFSIHMIQPTSRQTQVLELYRTFIETNDTAWIDADWVCHDTGTSIESESDDAMDVVNDIPTSVDEIPTAADIQTIQTEITTLHDRLQQLQQQRTSLTQEITTMQALQEQQRDISTPMLNMKDSITKHITQTVPVLQTLREYQTTSYQLQQQMCMIEQQRKQKENLNDIVVVHPKQPSHPPTKPKLKTIQERYEKDSLMVRSRTSSSSGDTKIDRPNVILSAVLGNLLGTHSTTSK